MTEHTDPDWAIHLPLDAYVEMSAELAELTGEERAVALAAWRSTAEAYADPEVLAALTADHGQPPTPERDGYTIAVHLPPAASEAVRDQLFDAIADAVHAAEDGNNWTAGIVGLPGDPFYIWHARAEQAVRARKQRKKHKK